MNTDELAQRIRAHVSRLSLSANCLRCGQNDWAVAGLSAIADFNPETRALRLGTLMPLVALVCRQCGTVWLLNAVTLGLVSSDPDKGRGELQP